MGFIFNEMLNKRLITITSRFYKLSFLAILGRMNTGNVKKIIGGKK